MKSCQRLKQFSALVIFAALTTVFPSLCFSQSDDYNIKIGDLLIDFTAFVDYAYNDNVTTIPEGVVDHVDPSIVGPRTDYILSYGIDAAFEWQLTDNNILGFVLGMRNQDYQELDYLDSSRTFFNIKPESELDFTMLIGSVEIRFFDKFSYNVDGSNAVLVDIVDDAEEVVDDNGIPIVRGRAISVEVDRYAAFSNEFGVESVVVLNPMEWTISLSRYDLIPDDDDGDEYVEQLGRTLRDDRWEFTRRTEWIADTRLYYPLGRDNGVGLFGSFTINDYHEDILADSYGWNAGFLVDWALGEKTVMSANVGYDDRTFEEENTLRRPYAQGGGFADTIRGKNMFWKIEILHLLGDTFNHKLSYSKMVGLGRVTNEQITKTLAWDFVYEGIRNVNFTGGAMLVDADDSGPSQYAEDYDLFMATLGFEIILTENLNSRINYSYIDKDSDDDDRDFSQSRASVSLNYDF